MVHRHFYRVLANYGIEHVGSVYEIENGVYIYIYISIEHEVLASPNDLQNEMQI